MTAKRANKPHRLSTLLATLAFNDYSDYEGAPESSDFRALPLRLSTFRLCPSDFVSGRRTPGSPGGAIRADPRKNRPAHAGHARNASGHAWTRTGPRRPPKPAGGSVGGRICKPHPHGNGPQRATGNATHGNGGDANATRKRRAGAGRKKNKAG